MSIAISIGCYSSCWLWGLSMKVEGGWAQYEELSTSVSDGQFYALVVHLSLTKKKKKTCFKWSMRGRGEEIRGSANNEIITGIEEGGVALPLYFSKFAFRILTITSMLHCRLIWMYALIFFINIRFKLIIIISLLILNYHYFSITITSLLLCRINWTFALIYIYLSGSS